MVLVEYLNLKNKYDGDHAIQKLITSVISPYENQDTEVGGGHINLDDPIRDMQRVNAAFDSDSGTRLHHFLITPSSENQVMRDLVKKAMDAVSDYIGSNYQTIYVVHKNEHDSHVHLIFNAVSWKNGRKFTGDKSGVYWVLESIKHACQLCGDPETYLTSKYI